jgi:hypothetical protein
MDQQDSDYLELSLVYGKIEDDGPIPQDDIEVGNTNDEELEEALLTLAENAMTKRASIEFVTELRELLVTYKNAFRLRLDQDPPAKVRPLIIEPKPNAKPQRIPARKYAPPQEELLSAKMTDVERLGLVKRESSCKVGKPTIDPTKGWTREVPIHPRPPLYKLTSRTGLMANAKYGG